MCQRINRRREDRRADRFVLPAKNKLRGGTANAALARAHAAARVQLGRPPCRETRQPLSRHVFATAYKCIVVGQIPQLVAQYKGPIEGLGETPLAGTGRKAGCRLLLFANGGETGNFSFGQRSSAPPMPVSSPAQKTPGTVLSWKESTTTASLWSSQPSRPGNSRLGISPKPHARMSHASVQVRWPARRLTASTFVVPWAVVGQQSRAYAYGEVPSDRRCPARACRARVGGVADRSGRLDPRGLLGHQRHDSFMLLQKGGHGKQQRPAAGDDHAACRRIGMPDLTRACNPPAPTTLGKVQPGKGRNCSRAPVARINFS